MINISESRKGCPVLLAGVAERFFQSLGFITFGGKGEHGSKTMLLIDKVVLVDKTLVSS